MTSRVKLSPEELLLVRKYREERIHYVKGWNDAISAATQIADPAELYGTLTERYQAIIELKKDL